MHVYYFVLKEINLPYATLYYVAPIIFIDYKRNTELGFIEIKELIRHSEELSGGRPYVVLADVRKGVKVTPMGKKVVNNPAEAPLHCGSAVVVPGSLLRTAANFFGKLSRPPYPYRAFTNRHQAIDWLLTLSVH